MRESACRLESALRRPPCSCAHCPDHLLSVFQTHGCIENSKQKPNHRYTSGGRGGGRHDRGRPGARSHRHSVAEAGPTDGRSCSSQYLLTVSKLCKGQGPGERSQPSAGEAVGSSAITAPALPRGGHSLQALQGPPGKWSGKWGDWPLLSCGAVGKSSAPSGSRRVQESKGAPTPGGPPARGNCPCGQRGVPVPGSMWVTLSRMSLGLVLMTFAVKDILSLQRLPLVAFHHCGPVGTALSPAL